MHIVLIGLRGSGKSTLARLFAETTGCLLIDLDERVLASFKKPSVTAVWSELGEAAWRDAEFEHLTDALMSERDAIIALGGGVPMIDRAHKMLQQKQRRGEIRIIYLRAAPDLLISRLAIAPRDRPALSEHPWEDEVRAILAQRDPVYHALADAELDMREEQPHVTLQRLHELITPGNRS